MGGPGFPPFALWGGKPNWGLRGTTGFGGGKFAWGRFGGLGRVLLAGFFFAYWGRRSRWRQKMVATMQLPRATAASLPNCSSMRGLGLLRYVHGTAMPPRTTIFRWRSRSRRLRIACWL